MVGCLVVVEVGFPPVFAFRALAFFSGVTLSSVFLSSGVRPVGSTLPLFLLVRFLCFGVSTTSSPEEVLDSMLGSMLDSMPRVRGELRSLGPGIFFPKKSGGEDEKLRVN